MVRAADRVECSVADRPSALIPVRSPVRTCVGCRARAPQIDVVRVVARPKQADHSGEWVAWLDPDRRLPGRGAYLHLNLNCLDLAERRRALPRALRLNGGIDVSELRGQMQQAL
ncbi:MAG: DUF448 domain-containing protein [Actinomycetia bacterium]|nr:DUF448 domain-containing protein [Actinomycetes bacterium]